jgi:Holliday junction resolvasome RuvABC DNA-binding subunit
MVVPRADPAGNCLRDDQGYNVQHDPTPAQQIAGRTSNQAIVKLRASATTSRQRTHVFWLPAVGAEVGLHIHTHVREDQIALFGFLRLADKQLFEKLLTVSSMDPSLPSRFSAACRPTKWWIDSARTTWPGSRIGIGRKTAEDGVGAARQAAAAVTGRETTVPTMSPSKKMCCRP